MLAVGDTEIGDPIVASAAAVVSVYHFHAAPVPSDPPVTEKFDDPPVHTVVGFAVAPEGEVDAALKVTVTLLNTEFPQAPSARTQ